MAAGKSAGKKTTSKANDKTIGFDDDSYQLDEYNSHSYEVNDCK